MPDHHETPFILTGLGTGIAPIRSIIQDRVHAHDQGQKVGPMGLFFGNLILYYLDWFHDQSNISP